MKKYLIILGIFFIPYITYGLTNTATVITDTWVYDTSGNPTAAELRTTECGSTEHQFIYMKLVTPNVTGTITGVTLNLYEKGRTVTDTLTINVHKVNAVVNIGTVNGLTTPAIGDLLGSITDLDNNEWKVVSLTGTWDWNTDYYLRLKQNSSQSTACWTNIIDYSSMDDSSNKPYLEITYTATEEPPTTGTSTATSTATMGDIAFGITIIITLLSLGLVGFAFNSISKRKPWKA